MALFLNNCVIIKIIYEPFLGRDGKMKKATFIVIIVLSIFTTCLFGATKDTTPPTVSITSPKDNAVVSGVVTIKVDASDNSGIAKVEFYIGESKVGEDSSKPYEYSWDTKKTKDGTYVLTVKATDGAGNKNSKSIKVVVKNTKVGTWHKTFGGKEYDQANYVQQTADGGYIVAGWSYSFDSGGYDAYILKLNSKGEVEWQKAFGGESSDGANSIQQTKDGGYIVAGWTNSFGSGGYDTYILKLNSKGEVEWQKTFGGVDDDVAESIQQTKDGGYIVAGRTYSFGSGGQDVYILKLNSKGEAEWQKTFGGKDNDGAFSIQQTTDGGCIVAGWTSSFGSGGQDAYILKLNSKREVEWQKAFDGGDDDVAFMIQQTADGGYIAAGWTSSFGSGERDAYILKLNSKGQLEWHKTFGGEDYDVANSIQQTADGGYIVAGWTDSFGSGLEDVYILKLNSKGEIDTTPPEVEIISPNDGVELGGTIEINIDAKDDYDLEKVTLYIDGKEVKEYTSGLYKYSWNSSKASEGTHTITAEAVDKSGNVGTKSVMGIMDKIKDISWQKTFGGERDDEANSIQQTADGGYIVAGWTNSFGSGWEDVYILKLNSKGEIEWQKTFGEWYEDVANSIQQTTDGGYIVAGWTESFGFGYYTDIYILKLNSKGEVEWQKTFGGEYDDGAKSIKQTTDGGYIVAGWTKSFGSGEGDVYILKLDSKGEVEWQKTFGGKYDDEANSIQQTTDGGYVVAGWTKSFGSAWWEDVYILKLNSKGDLEWQKTFGGGDDDVATSIQQTMDGGYIVAGWTKSFGSGGEDAYILKLDSKGEIEE